MSDRDVRSCEVCRSTGSKRVKAGKSAMYHHKKQCREAIMLDLPVPPMPQRIVNCDTCSGLGILPTPSSSKNPTRQTTAFTGRICIIGGGIGGLAFALAAIQRGLNVTVYEKDAHFSTRSQGYALTMQQGFTQLRKLGFSIEKLRDIGTTSSCHITLNPSGEVIGRIGRERWGVPTNCEHKDPKRFNIQLPRQYLRHELLESLPEGVVQWGKKLTSVAYDQQKIYFADNTSDSYDLLVGADGIWSQFTLPHYPLQYLGVIVILGRGRVTTTNEFNLGVDKIWQTVDGVTRMYAMPFGIEGETMWQLSWQCSEQEAKALGGQASLLLAEAKRRVTGWHDPWMELLESTSNDNVTGYPAYDRWPIPTFEALPPRVVVLGDAAHPLSPFKGQGANQALADGVELATILCAGSDVVDSNSSYTAEERGKYDDTVKKCDIHSYHNDGDKADDRNKVHDDQIKGDSIVLDKIDKNDKRARNVSSTDTDPHIQRFIHTFHHQMRNRVAVKVKQSREATGVLHSQAVLVKGDHTRGKAHASKDETDLQGTS